ncbi:STAS domain-containing protein [Nitratidesulfovibrio termitidis]|uniref:STAS domain-containing protein n=1 Tax=Nitratidesulfovibrio termitidis TaxID=42252 RepID=UPI0004205B69|nr:STAS domain-containing protein [Nitratidesulfovibrio termitidis]
MVGDLQVLGRMHASLEAIGTDHVGAQGGDVVAATHGAFGRAVNWLRSAFGGGAARANQGAVGNLVAQMRAAHVSDAALDVAQRLLSAQAAPGRPLSGRAAAQVLDTVIKWTSEEQAQSANLDINIAGLQDHLASEFDTIFEQRYARFGMKDVAPTAEDRGVIMDALRTKCRQWGERHAMRAPGLAEAREMMDEACRVRGLARLDASLAARLEAGASRLVIDLGGIEYISSAGLRGILGLLKACKSGGVGLAFCGIGEMVGEVFRISGFTGMLSIHATADDAVAALA